MFFRKTSTKKATSEDGTRLAKDLDEANAAYLAYQTGVVPRMYSNGQWVDGKTNKSEWDFTIKAGKEFDRRALIYIGTWRVRTIYLESIEPVEFYTITVSIPHNSVFI